MQLITGDCLREMGTLDACSVDSVVTDPPYGLKFMGKAWDHGVPGMEFWVEALRVAKPGAYLLAFGGTRTFHRLAVAIEDAGWEIRDTIMWVYGSGFPKSHNVSKALDKGVDRVVVGEKFVSPKGISSAETRSTTAAGSYGGEAKYVPITIPATYLAKQWDGWGTALKPAWEPIIVARKPLEGTVADNVAKWGTGAMNIDGARVGVDEITTNAGDKFPNLYGTYKTAVESKHIGRWPANLIHDGSDEVVGLFPDTKSTRSNRGVGLTKSDIYGSADLAYNTVRGHNDSGSAARFFYCAKASKRDRDEGLDGFEVKQKIFNGQNDKSTINGYADGSVEDKFTTQPGKNHHATVKPTELMRYLCRLVTQPGGVVLDPFMGSGSTGKAAMLEGFDFIGIEQEPEYVKIAEARIKYARATI